MDPHNNKNKVTNPNLALTVSLSLSFSVTFKITVMVKSMLKPKEFVDIEYINIKNPSYGKTKFKLLL